MLLKGNEADPRMRAASKRRGIEITSISRPLKPSDFRDFDIILAMDKQNRGEVDSGFWIERILLNHLFHKFLPCTTIMAFV